MNPLEKKLQGGEMARGEGEGAHKVFFKSFCTSKSSYKFAENDCKTTPLLYYTYIEFLKCEKLYFFKKILQ